MSRIDHGQTTSTAFTEMKRAYSISELRSFLNESSDKSASVGFVPTMGALHSGHASLISKSASENDLTVVSIFVNPTQFNVQSDFDKYPRTIEEDIEIGRQHGADVVFIPTSDEMYPPDFRTYIEPGHAADPMEGQGRPGHFRGVATVVVKLLNIVSPDIAYFGKKDFQQLAVIRQTVEQLNLNVTIEGVETVREPDGLALSSRNVRLSTEARHQAPVIYRALCCVRDSYAEGVRDSSALEKLAIDVMQSAPLCRVEYATISDAQTLESISTIDRNTVLCIAAWFDDVRLIDNIELTAIDAH